MVLPKPPQLPLPCRVNASPSFPPPCIPNSIPPSPDLSPPSKSLASSLPPSSECRPRTGRRLVSVSTALLLALFPRRAVAGGSILDKYVKKKKLDPLDAYVPAVILSQLQIEDLGKTLEGDNPEFAFCRSLLRSGPAASLRINIRAVAQYASESGDGNTAFDDVDRCLRALEELDSLLLHASRKEPDASVSSMKEKIGVAVKALDSLLQTVPENILDKGKAIADAYRSPADEEPELSDPEIEQLQSIL
ncbi:hypothetical protein MLD38_006498 [Melastoma candidum]|uniref:Uncharacterized protein n=1 Tax=Melastoma candidum TaxID=119954 RepID=A0ACB9RMS9_9MYRT|nr:hypothetical protein MLD38_006498 [Melastoma candidum]